MNKVSNKGCEFGEYNGLTYRICYGLTEDGKMDYSTPHYEFYKYCHCEACNRRFNDRCFDYNVKPINSLTVTTDNMELFSEVEGIINNYTCGKKHYVGRKYILLFNGKVEVKIHDY